MVLRPTRMDVGIEQSQGGQGRRAHGKAFADGRGGIAQGIQFIGHGLDVFPKASHFSNSAGVVRDGTVSVDGHGHANGRQHAHGSQSNAVDAA